MFQTIKQLWKLIQITSVAFFIISSQNIIKSNDFEKFTEIGLNIMPYKALINILYNLKNGGKPMEKNYTYITTKCIEINSKTNLCQTINLQKGYRCYITFDAFISKVLTDVYAPAYLNEQLISWLFIPTSQTFGSQLAYFYAEEEVNILCFNETHMPADLWLSQGIMLDNITVSKVSHYFIKIEYEVKEEKEQINMVTNITEEEIIQNLFAQYRLYVNSKAFKQQEIQIKQRKNNRIILFTPRESVNLMDISFVKQYDEPSFEFSISESQKDRRFISLDNNTKQIVQDINSVVQAIFSPAKIIVFSIRNSLFSYIILGFLSFWNLSLLYYFQQFKAMPEFSKHIYEYLMRLQFEQTSLFNILESILNIQTNEWEDILTSSGRQYALKQNGSFLSFGSFGFSSKPLEAHINTLLLIAMFISKMLIFFVVYLLLPKKLQKKIKLFKFVILLLSAEMISIAPESFIATGLGTTNGAENVVGLIYKTVHLLITMICISCAFLLPALQVSDNLLELKKQHVNGLLVMLKLNSLVIADENIDKDNSKRMNEKFTSQLRTFFKQQSKKAWHLYLFYLLENSLVIFIPFMVIFTDQLNFIAGMWVYLTLQSWLLFRCFKYLESRQKILKISMNCVWIVHNLAFTIFLYFQDEYYYLQSQQQQKLMVLTGIVCCITVLVGGVIELINEIINIIIWVKQSVNQLKKACCCYNQIQQQGQTDKEGQNINNNFLIKKSSKDMNQQITIFDKQREVKKSAFNQCQKVQQTGPKQNNKSNLQVQQIVKQSQAQLKHGKVKFKKVYEDNYYKYLQIERMKKTEAIFVSFLSIQQ